MQMHQIADLTVVILTKNEEQVISRCINSVPFATEILVIDSESTDSTCTIAADLGARIVIEPWPDNFAVQRNRGDAHVQTGWILHLDADETVSPDMEKGLVAFFSTKIDDQITAGRFLRKELIFGKWIKHGGWYQQHKVRLYRKGAGEWSGRVHENFSGFPGEPFTFDGSILHDSYTDIHTFIDKFNRYSTIDAEEGFASGRKFSLFRLFFQPLERFLGRYVVHRGYRDGMHGFVLAALIGMNYFLRYIKLWEKEFAEKSDDRSTDF
ncbi:MAG: glycosyltransferase family 2 protein [Desulfuromonadaceae bacterium]